MAQLLYRRGCITQKIKPKRHWSPIPAGHREGMGVSGPGCDGWSSVPAEQHCRRRHCQPRVAATDAGAGGPLGSRGGTWTPLLISTKVPSGSEPWAGGQAAGGQSRGLCSCPAHPLVTGWHSRPAEPGPGKYWLVYGLCGPSLSCVWLYL